MSNRTRTESGRIVSYVLLKKLAHKIKQREKQIRALAKEQRSLFVDEQSMRKVLPRSFLLDNDNITQSNSAETKKSSTKVGYAEPLLLSLESNAF